MRFMAEVGEKLDAHTYPATTAELIEEYGEMELELANGSETLGDALGRLADETFEGSEDARLAAYSAVSSKAIGRKNYSDRDAPTVGENPHEHLSL